MLVDHSSTAAVQVSLSYAACRGSRRVRLCGCSEHWHLRSSQVCLPVAALAVRHSPLLSVRVTGSEAATASEARDTAKLESQLPEQRSAQRGREVLEFKLNVKFEGNL